MKQEENKESLSDKNNEFNYGKIALILIIIVIGVWFFSHFRVSIVAVNKIDSIVEVVYYDCPGVALRTNPDGYFGCKEHHTENIID